MPRVAVLVKSKCRQPGVGFRLSAAVSRAAGDWIFMRILVKYVLASSEPKESLVVKGWVRTRRDAKGFSFLELNDGSCLASLQVVVDAGTPGSEDLAHFTTGASAVVEGNLVPSPAPGQKWELRAARVGLVGSAEAGYPLQTK